MIWIGLTGGIATGKSTVSQIITSHKYTVIDADQVAREVVAKDSVGLARVVQDFGPDILTKEGDLNRQKMADIIFSKPEKKRLLEGIIHPLVQARVQEKKKHLESLGEKMAFYDVPLLFENSLQKNFDATVLVSCSLENQIQRLMQRNQLSKDQALLRISNQLSLEEKKQNADFVLENNGTINDLETQVINLFPQLLKLKSKA